MNVINITMMKMATFARTRRAY